MLGTGTDGTGVEIAAGDRAESDCVIEETESDDTDTIFCSCVCTSACTSVSNTGSSDNKTGIVALGSVEEPDPKALVIDTGAKSFLCRVAFEDLLL